MLSGTRAAHNEGSNTVCGCGAELWNSAAREQHADPAAHERKHADPAAHERNVQKRPDDAHEVKRFDRIAKQQLFEPRLHSPHRIHIKVAHHSVAFPHHFKSQGQEGR
jgi:hypothetical protein